MQLTRRRASAARRRRLPGGARPPGAGRRGRSRRRRPDLQGREQHYWAYSAINWVTNQGPASDKLLDDFSGGVFEPKQPLTREQLARTLVIALGMQDDAVRPVSLPDMVPTDPYYWFVQIALAHGLLRPPRPGSSPISRCSSGRPTAPSCACSASEPQGRLEHVTALNPDDWDPTPGGRPARPVTSPGRWRRASSACATTTLTTASSYSLRTAIPPGRDGVHPARRPEPLRVADRQPQQLRQDHSADPQFAREADRLVRPRLHRRPIRVGQRESQKDSPYGYQARRVRLLGLGLVGAEDPLRIPHLGKCSGSWGELKYDVAEIGSGGSGEE